MVQAFPEASANSELHKKFFVGMKHKRFVMFTKACD